MFPKKEDTFYKKNQIKHSASLESALIDFAVAHTAAFGSLALFFNCIAINSLWKSEIRFQLRSTHIYLNLKARSVVAELHIGFL